MWGHVREHCIHLLCWKSIVGQGEGCYCHTVVNHFVQYTKCSVTGVLLFNNK
jgi:hypothetical protein